MKARADSREVDPSITHNKFYLKKQTHQPHRIKLPLHSQQLQSHYPQSHSHKPPIVHQLLKWIGLIYLEFATVDLVEHLQEDKNIEKYSIVTPILLAPLLHPRRTHHSQPTRPFINTHVPNTNTLTNTINCQPLCHITNHFISSDTNPVDLGYGFL